MTAKENENGTVRAAATLGDVAAAAGVSVSVVSRVLSQASDARVSVATRERVRDAARALGYRPNFAARALRASRSFIIALIVPDLTNAIFTELMEGVDQTAIASDYSIVLGRAEDMRPGATTLEKLVGERRVDGLLVQGLDEPSPELVASLAASKVPVVFINSPGTAGPGSVVLPDAAGGAAAAEHLIELGHRELGVIGGSTASYTAAKRTEGFVTEAAEHGISVRGNRIIHAGYAVEDGRTGLRALMASAEPPTAVFVANVNAAFGVLVEARELGIRVPQDLSVLAMHDAGTAEYTWPPLTTVRMPLRRMGEIAAQELLRRLEDPVSPPRDIHVSDPAPRVVVRESTAPPSTPSAARA